MSAQYDSVPSAFWERIEGANGDIEKFKASLRGLSETELRQVFHQYKRLSENLVRTTFDQLPQHLQEEPVEKLEEIANWVITQGRSVYLKVLQEPQAFPRREDIQRPVFAGAIIRVYTSQFGPWQA